MKRVVLIGCMATSLCFTVTSYADFTVHLGKANSCEQLAGHWSGSGKAYNWAIGECVYHGVGTASPLDEAGNFTVEVSADKDSGSFICPNHSATKLSGLCVDGLVIFNTEYGNLVGNFVDKAGDAKGTLTVSPGITADVSIKFQRVE